MPLQVEIKINGNHIDTVHIGRVEELYSNIQTSNYLATMAWDDDAGRPDWAAGINFEHKYDDGALICVRKALQALENRVD